MMDLSLPAAARRWVSTGLNLTWWMLSTPHWKVLLGTCLPRVHSWVASPQVAKLSLLVAWERQLTMCLLTMVSLGVSLILSSTAQVLMVLSSPTDMSSSPLAVKVTVLTTPLWACQLARHFLLVRFHSLSSPEASDDTRLDRALGCLAMQVSPSL